MVKLDVKTAGLTSFKGKVIEASSFTDHLTLRTKTPLPMIGELT